MLGRRDDKLATGTALDLTLDVERPPQKVDVAKLDGGRFPKPQAGEPADPQEWAEPVLGGINEPPHILCGGDDHCMLCPSLAGKLDTLGGIPCNETVTDSGPQNAVDVSIACSYCARRQPGAGHSLDPSFNVGTADLPKLDAIE